MRSIAREQKLARGASEHLAHSNFNLMFCFFGDGLGSWLFSGPSCWWFLVLGRGGTFWPIPMLQQERRTSGPRRRRGQAVQRWERLSWNLPGGTWGFTAGCWELDMCKQSRSHRISRLRASLPGTWMAKRTAQLRVQGWGGPQRQSCFPIPHVVPQRGGPC